LISWKTNRKRICLLAKIDVPHFYIGHLLISLHLNLPMQRNLFTLCALLSAPYFALSQSGTLDLTFNGTGKVKDQISNSFAPLNQSSALVSTSDRIYVAGTTDMGEDIGIGLLVLNQDGTLQTSFANGGKLIYPATPGWENANDIILQSDGKLLIGGYTLNDFFIIRINSDGSLDETWGEDGMVVTDVTGTQERINRLGLQADGKVIAAGYSGTNNDDIPIVRYNTDGEIDHTFGNDGFVNIDFSGSADDMEDMIIQPDGSILIIGSTTGTGNTNGLVVRLTPEGEFDQSFNSNGYTMVDLGDAEVFNGATRLPDGDIICVGRTGYDYGLFKLTDEGKSDSSFGENGFLSIHEDVLLIDIEYHSEKIITFGYTVGESGRDFAMLTFDTRGNLNPCFGTNGLFRSDLGGTEDYLTRGYIQEDGKFLLVGDDQNSEFVIERVTSLSFAKNVTVNLCHGETYVFANQTLSENGEYSHTFISQSGCDSVVTVKIVIIPEIKSTTQAAICNGKSYLFANQLYNSAGTYSVLLKAKSGCDSTATLQLGINPTYSWSFNKTICKDEMFDFGNSILSSSGIYSHTFKTQLYGCDSIVQVSLQKIILDNTITQNGATLASNEDGAIYQWLLANGSPIPGETNQSFTATSEGAYEVTVSKENCSVTSGSVEVIIEEVIMSIDDLSLSVKIYPNPSTGKVKVLLSKKNKLVKLVLRNLNNSLICQREFSNEEAMELELQNTPDGVYILEVTTDEGPLYKRIVKMQ
jgi:uncharacterized delta-60 repeat protein